MKNKENLREKQVNLRLTQAEYERLTRTAQDHGIGRAAENQNNFFRWNLMQAVTRSRI